MPRHTSALLIALTALLMGCTGAPETALTQPLVDLLSRDDVEVLDSPTARTSPRALWRFDAADPDDDPLGGWMDGGGVTELEVRGGLLTGETNAESAIVYVEWHDELERRDLNAGFIPLCAAKGLGTAAIIERV